MNCQAAAECSQQATTPFRVRYDGELLYRKEVCDYHAKLWRASKYSTVLEQ